MNSLLTVRAVFFDLDGTLADTAPDLAAAINQMRTQRKLEPVPYDQLRAQASGGARGLLQAGFGITPDDASFDAMREEFFDAYEATRFRHSCLFDGVQEVIDRLNTIYVPWGIVTNKSKRFTEPLVQSLNLQGVRAIVSGDSTPYIKPHPAPLIEAARQIDVQPSLCCYVGDDLRDIQAAKAAGMKSIAALWGYGGTEDAKSWGADWLLALPVDVLGVVVE